MTEAKLWSNVEHLKLSKTQSNERPRDARTNDEDPEGLAMTQSKQVTKLLIHLAGLVFSISCQPPTRTLANHL